MDALHNAIQHGSWKRIAALPGARAIGLVLMIVLPGGFVVPACWAAVFAIRRSWRSKPPSERLQGYRAALRRLARGAHAGILR